jgi:glyoxylase-like metal-dependent hydrolase (beta-lactamase superfamily II)
MEVVPGLHWVERIWDTKVYVLFEPDRVVVVDAAMPGRAHAIWDYLAAQGHSPTDVSEIWITHGDIDHMGSVAALKEGSGAELVAHREDVLLLEGIEDRELGARPGAAIYQPLFNWAVRHVLRYQPAAVDRAVEDGEDLGGWQVVHTPGHTAGSASFYHRQRKIVIVGDALNYQRGRLGAPPALFSTDLAQARASIAKIAGLDFEVCCFGHGPPLMEDARQRVQTFADSLSS